MAQSGFTPISLYYTTTAAAVPTAGNLVNGELAINITDGKLYYKNNSAVVTLLASSTGASGDVVGPASATANGIALFNSTTGKLIKDSAASDGLIYGVTVGRGAGAVSTNTAVGASALAANTSGEDNTATGYQAGYTNVSGVGGTFLGMSAGYFVTGSYNTAIGRFSGGTQAISAGTNNTSIGNTAGYRLTAGLCNTAIGDSALFNNTTASGSTAVGYQALYTSNRTADVSAYNSAFGYQAGFLLGTGQFNTFIGLQAGYFCSSGVANTFIGVNASGGGAGSSVTGSKNVIIGGYTGSAAPISATGSNYIVLSDGDGNPRAYWNGAAATFNGGLAVTGTLSATGNMSVGATLASWDSGYKATQYSWGSVIADNTYLGSISLGSNIYATGNETFSTVSAGTYYGARYRMDSNGAHKWYTSSAAVSAGAVTMTNTMTLGAAGGLAVTGTLSATLDAAIGQATSSFPSGGGMEIYNATAPRLKLTNSTTGTASTDGTHLLVSGSDFYIQQREAASVIIATNGTNAVTVDASQNVGIGANISGSYKLEVNGNIVARRTTDNNPHFFSMSNSGSVCFLETINGLAASYLPINFKQTHTSTSQTPMVLDASGNLLVGCTALGAASGFGVGPNSGSSFIDICHVTATPSGSSYARFFYNSSPIGSITQSGTTAVLYNTTSDQRLKENIVDADSASSLIDSLQVRKFDWKSDNSHQRYGFVAQELVTVAPEAVHQPNDPEEMMAVDYSKLVPMLVKEIQSLRKRITALEAK